MQVDFRHVLAGIGAGRSHQYGHAFVDDVASLDGVAVGQQMARQGQGAFACRTEDAQQDGFSLRAAQADDGDAALARCGGDGGDGIGGQLHKSVSICFQYSVDGIGSRQG